MTCCGASIDRILSFHRPLGSELTVIVGQGRVHSRTGIGYLAYGRAAPRSAPTLQPGERQRSDRALHFSRPGQTRPGLSPKANSKRMNSCSSATSVATRGNGLLRSLSELETMRGPGGPTIERDVHFK